MKKLCLIPLFFAICGSFSIVSSVSAQIPQLINYQGRVAVSGTNFTGTGQFAFALVDGSSTTTYWSNDGTSTAGSQPTHAVSLNVSNGLYSVLLGDATLTNMSVVPATVFANSKVLLRVWFNDGTHGWQQLTPDQRIAAVGYAMMAGNVADGAITSAKIASGAVGNSQLAANAVQSANIASGAVGSSQLALGAFPVAQSVSGTSQTATTNTSYVVTGTSLVTFSFPASANIGDVVQISGAGAGWKTSLPNWNWIARESRQHWTGVASSSDGTKLVAVANEDIFTSTDSGVTWRPQTGGNGNWSGVASSSDGSKLAAVVTGAVVCTSTNSGASFTAQASGYQNWFGVASSSDGTKLVAVAWGGQIYTSTNSGGAWTARASVQNWSKVASSSDGTKLAAVVGGGQIYISTNSGGSWTAHASTQNWTGIASSSDGTKLTAVVSGGQIYTSTDSGSTWTAHASSQNWTAIASSADGTKLAAVVSGGQIYISTDSGNTWAAQGSIQNWRGVASSSDGTKLVAVVYGDGAGVGGQIYTATGFISGQQGSMATFQYVGNGQWIQMSQVPQP